MKRYDTPPKTRSSLEQRLRNLVADDAVQLRTRRQIGYMAVVAALATHARHEDGRPLFVVKGGVAVELLVGLRARATKDLDAAVRGPADEIEVRLRDALAEGWDGFTFRLASWTPIGETGAHRGDIKLAFRGQPFATVLFEAAPAEGESGRELQFVGNVFVEPEDLGLTRVGEVPVVTLAYLIAQKLHACTDRAIPGWDNDRARDLIDVLLVRQLVADGELAHVRRVCVEIFELRAKHAWPPAVTIPSTWPQIYAAEVAKTPGYEPADVEGAAREVTEFIAQIDAAR